MNGIFRARNVLIAIIVAAVALSAWFLPNVARGTSVAMQAVACEEKASGDEKLECWMQIVFTRLRAEGMVPAFNAFAYLYDTYPMFGATGCHQHAHKIGDVAYYDFYVAKGLTLDEMDFPQETTSCGYGFFHGFIEHLVQDHTDQQFVVDTCEYLRTRLSSAMRDIGTICYHASGHGFMQAEADDLPEEMWGDAKAIVQRPLLACEKLPTNEAEVEDCREGVFNVVSDWMTVRDFDLAYDMEDPFKLCKQLPEKWHWACYYELGMKLEPIVGNSPLKAAQYVQGIKDLAIREMTFGVMVAGMMQREAPLNGYGRLLGECVQIVDDILYKKCITSSANGMMEHGAPGKEYEKVLDLCSTPELSKRGGDASCYDSLMHRLSRFYTSEKKREICGEFPSRFQDTCRTAP